MRRRVVLVGAAVAGVIALAAVGLRRQKVAPVVSSVTTLAPPPKELSRIAWPTGVAFTYRVSFAAETRGGIEMLEPASGAAALDGELTLRGYGDAGGASLVGVSLGKLTRHRLEVLGQDALADAGATERLFAGREAFLEIAPDGAIRTVRFHPTDPALFKNLILGLVQPLDVNLRSGVSWQIVERTTSGDALTRYQRTVEPGTLTRDRLKYDRLIALEKVRCDDCRQDLGASDTLRFDPTGWLRGLDASETLRVTKLDGTQVLTSTMHLELQLIDHATFQPAPLPLASLDSAQLGDTVEDADVQKRLLASRVGDMTLPRMMFELDRYAAATGAPAKDFVWRASGLLMQHPELCAHLAERFQANGASLREKALLVDLLASAAHPQAQAAMRAALGSAAAQKEPAYGLLLERLAFVPLPDRATASFVAGEYDRARRDGDRDLVFAAAHTLGAVAGHLAKSEPQLARRYDAQLRDDLSAAKSLSEKVQLLDSLANVRSDEDVRLAESFAKASEPELRAAAATALRGATDEDARSTLVALVGDRDPSVEAASLASLGSTPLDSDELDRLSKLVQAGNTSPAADDQLVAFLSRHAEDGPQQVHDVLAFVGKRAGDPQLRGKVNLVLDQLAAR